MHVPNFRDDGTITEILGGNSVRKFSFLVRHNALADPSQITMEAGVLEYHLALQEPITYSPYTLAWNSSKLVHGMVLKNSFAPVYTSHHNGCVYCM